MGHEFDRRRFIFDVAGIGGAFTLGVTGLISVGCRATGGSDTLAVEDRPASGAAAVAALPQQPTRLSAIDPNNTTNLKSYARAVKKMKATRFPRQIRDENGQMITTDWWEAHAIIHMNYCPHGNWYFLPWHRAYLYYFERVIKKFSGDPNFALPYWDWAADGRIPPAFWTDPDLSHKLPNPNPRHYEARDAGPNDAVSQSAVGKPVIESILNLNNFLSFGSGRTQGLRSTGGGTGQLEGVPHNTTHGFIGGDMGAFLSPRDPIFWLHHCNIDRLWATWQERMTAKGRSTLPPKAPAFGSQKTLTPQLWLGTTLGVFYEVNLEVESDMTATNASAMTVQQVQSIDKLGYRYGTPGQFGLADTAAGGPLMTEVEPTEQLIIDLTRKIEVDDAAKTVLFNINSSPQVRSVLKKVKDRMDNNPANLPNIRLYADSVIVPANPQTASLEFYIMNGSEAGGRPTYLGLHNFFGTDHVHAGHAGGRPTVNLIFDLQGPIEKLLAAGQDLSIGDDPIQLLVRVKSDRAFPGHEQFDAIKLRLEYEAYD